MNELSEKLGARIRYFRGVARLSQSELAGAAHLTNGYLSDVERGKVNISISNVNQLSRALGVPLSILLDFDGEGRREAMQDAIRAKVADVPDDMLAALHHIVLGLANGAEPGPAASGASGAPEGRGAGKARED